MENTTRNTKQHSNCKIKNAANIIVQLIKTVIWREIKHLQNTCDLCYHSRWVDVKLWVPEKRNKSNWNWRNSEIITNLKGITIFTFLNYIHLNLLITALVPPKLYTFDLNCPKNKINAIRFWSKKKKKNTLRASKNINKSKKSKSTTVKA